MKNNYQTTAHCGRSTPKKARSVAERAAQEAALGRMPDTVTIAIADLAGELEEGLLAFAVGTGLKVLDVILEDEATAIAGPRGRHDPERTTVRHGRDSGVVTLGGRQVAISRPRLRSADRSSEVQLPTYMQASSTELLGREAMAKMLAKLSTRRYAVGLEPVGTSVEARSRGTTKSAVSRRFVAATEAALAELMSATVRARPGGDHDRRRQFRRSLLRFALGIDIDGNKVPLALVEGDTENATLVGELLVGLRERGLDVTKPTLFVIDGPLASVSQWYVLRSSRLATSAVHPGLCGPNGCPRHQPLVVQPGQGSEGSGDHRRWHPRQPVRGLPAHDSGRSGQSDLGRLLRPLPQGAARRHNSPA